MPKTKKNPVRLRNQIETLLHDKVCAARLRPPAVNYDFVRGWLFPAKMAAPAPPSDDSAKWLRLAVIKTIPIFTAVKGGDLAAVKRCIAEGAPLDLQNQVCHGNPPPAIAAAHTNMHRHPPAFLARRMARRCCTFRQAGSTTPSPRRCSRPAPTPTSATLGT